MIEPFTKEDLKAWRGNRTQVEAAQALGIKYESYRAYEKGYRPMPSEMRNTVAGATLNEGKKNDRTNRNG